MTQDKKRAVSNGKIYILKSPNKRETRLNNKPEKKNDNTTTTN